MRLLLDHPFDDLGNLNISMLVNSDDTFSGVNLFIVVIKPNGMGALV